MFVSNRITECREAKKISVEGLSFELDKAGMRITRQTLYNWESGVTTPDANEVSFLAMFFNKPEQYFFDEKVYLPDKVNKAKQ